MPNSKLQGKVYKLPEKVFNKINQGLKMVDVTDEHARGYKRAKDLVANREVSYSQMNRLKNYFETYEGDGTDDEFRLIGGKTTKKWVEDSLNHDTESIKNVKKAKMDGGMENAFIRPHEKDNDNADPTNPYGGMVDMTKGSTMHNVMSGTQVYKSSERKNEAYEKEINSIKYLIEYMNK
jgi:hypothetical protein